MGIEASLDEIYGSSYAAAYYLKHIDAFPTDKKVYVIGSEGIVEELEGQGISWCGAQVQSNTCMRYENNDQSYRILKKIWTILAGRECSLIPK